MTAGFAGMIGTYILGPRLGFFRQKAPPKGTFEYTRQHYKKQESKFGLLKKRCDQMILEFEVLSSSIPIEDSIALGSSSQSGT